MEEPGDLTGLLRRFQSGDKAAKDDLVEAVYGELKALAARYMRRERDAHTLQTTALVNEAYLKLVNMKAANWQDRAHFFAVAAQVMRRILVDHARKCMAGKRGGDFQFLQLDEGLVFAEGKPAELVRLDDALEKLAAEDPRAGQVIELRYFGGLSIEETADVLKVSPRTVRREWMFGRSWLRTELKAGGDGQSASMG